MPNLLDIATTVTIGLLVGNELAVAVFVHPALNTLDPQSHLAAAQRLAHRLGRTMPFWYALGLVLLLLETWTHWSYASSRATLIAASLLWALIIAGTLVALVPRNNRIAAADPHHPYPGWQRDRQAWDSLHRLRVVGVAFAFLLFLLTALRPA